MITFPNGGRLVQDVSELPDLRGARRLYGDFETTSGDDTLDALNPWHHCWTAGIAVTADDRPGAWYVPVGCRHGGNLPISAVQDWWSDVLDSCERWVNHHAKFDAHVSANSMGVLCERPLVCTIVRAKLLDSDRMGHGLDALSADWLREDISKYEAAMRPYLHKCKDFGNIPVDVIGEYGCQDVMTNRRLDRYINERMPEECAMIAGIEEELTSILFRMERRGFCVNPTELMQRELMAYARMNQLDEELRTIVGRRFRPHVNEDCFDVLCNQYGLPILGWTQGDEDDPLEERGNASFDKAAMAAYAVHPDAPEGLVDRIVEFRKLNTLCSFFYVPYQRLHVNGVMHPEHNQMVRTGRLSAKEPNSQQLTPGVKSLIHPREDMAFLASDDSQVEYRVIAHVIENREIIEAYQRDPDTDFHQWMADMLTETMGVEVGRKPAKTMNFLSGYGGGKKKFLKALERDKNLVGGLPPEERRRRAERAYDAYHALMPELKRTSRRAGAVAASRGYIRNGYGRRRNLPLSRAHVAFNTVCQGWAADMMKDRMVQLSRVLPDDWHMLMQVHDELVLEVPAEVAGEMHTEVIEKKEVRLQRPRDWESLRWLQDVMETPRVPLRVPMRVSVGISTTDWRAASKTGMPFPTRKSETSSVITRDIAATT